MVLNHSIVGPMVDNHRKTVVPNGCLQPLHSIVMVLLKPLRLFDGGKNLALNQDWIAANMWKIPNLVFGSAYKNDHRTGLDVTFQMRIEGVWNSVKWCGKRENIYDNI